MRSVLALSLLLVVLSACGGASAGSRRAAPPLARCGSAAEEHAPCVIERLVAAARDSRDVVALRCVVDKRDAVQPLLDVLRDHPSETDGNLAVRLELVRRLGVLEREALQCRGLDTAGTTSVEVARR